MISTIRAMHRANCSRESISLALSQLERIVLGPASQMDKSDAQIFLQLSQTSTRRDYDAVQSSP
jgi:hypothetical protein